MDAGLRRRRRLPRRAAAGLRRLAHRHALLRPRGRSGQRAAADERRAGSHGARGRPAPHRFPGERPGRRPAVVV